MAVTDVLTLEGFVERAEDWLAGQAPRRIESGAAPRWGEGSDDVSVFHDLAFEEERALLERLMAWQRTKFDAGFGAIAWETEHGGAGLPEAFDQAFAELEADFQVPAGHETFSVTTRLVAPTIRVFGTASQQQRFIPPFLRTEVLCCQLFSEPEAGSDLAGVRTAARADGDEWLVTGQKVWSSGAQFAGWGLLIARTDPGAAKHAGLTAFLVPLDAPGVDVRPIRQMTGGASFSEVFLDEVRLPDELRLGPVGDGWKVALTTLAFERATSGSAQLEELGGSWEQVLALARWLGVEQDPLVRQDLARLYSLDRIRTLNGERLQAETAPGEAPGPLGSTGKLLWTQWMTAVSEVVTRLLGPRLAADTGEWGTFAWVEHVLGAPGYRIAGGSDEIQRNIIGERILGLPSEPRVDRGIPFNQLPR